MSYGQYANKVFMENAMATQGKIPLRVYLAQPMTQGDRSWNAYQGLKAQQILMEHGFAVLNPGLSFFHPAADKIGYETWLRTDLEWLQSADLVVRLPGTSSGADRETKHAEKCGIPVVVATVYDLIMWTQDARKQYRENSNESERQTQRSKS